MDSISKANFAPLPQAVAIGDHSTVLFLLETGASPEEQDPDGRSALALAISNGHLKSAAYLLEYGASPDAVDGTGKSPLQIASDAGSTAALNLLKGTPTKGETPGEFRKAPRIRANHSEVRTRARIRRKSRWTVIRTVFLYLVGASLAIGALELRLTFSSSSTQAVFDAITDNNETQLSRLLTNGVSANVRDSIGNSALLYAANNGRMDMVRLLLKNHADPNLGTPEGVAALKRAGIQHIEIIDALLDSGADPNRTDHRGRSLLAYACAKTGYSRLIALLLKHKANPNVVGENGPPLVSLIECGGDNKAEVSALLSAGADSNATDSAGTPVLVWAAEQGTPEVVQLLLAAGAKAAGADSLKRTALEAACRQERFEVVKMLIEHGADPNQKDKDGNTAVSYALSGAVDGTEESKSESLRIVRFLEQHGAGSQLSGQHNTTL